MEIDWKGREERERGRKGREGGKGREIDKE